MKKISVLIPCYNEEENVEPIASAVLETLKRDLPQYDYELVFIDNDSTDNTRPILRRLCKENPKIKAIFNAKNFGQFNSPYYGMLQVTGDCVIEMVADFQDPVDLIPQYVKAWEEGYKIVIGIKTSSKESRLMYWLRSCYYKTIRKLSEVEQIEHFTGSGLYDRDFIEVLRGLNDPTPFLRGIVAELGYKRKEIPYEQPKRRAGTTHNNFYRLYDAAMLSITSYTKVGLRLATFFGGFSVVVSMLVALVYLVMKLIWWERFPAGMAPMLIGMLFLGSVQIFFIGMVGEYVLSINQRVMRRPLVVEEERLNFNDPASDEAEQKERHPDGKTAKELKEPKKEEKGCSYIVTLQGDEDSMKYKIDVVRIRENSIQLNGWVIGKSPDSKAEFQVLDKDKKPVDFRVVTTRRDDVSQIYYKQVYDKDFGFDIQFPYERGADYWLLIRCDGKTARVQYNEELIAKRSSVAHKRMEKIKDLCNMETVRVAVEFGRKHGLKALFLKSRHKLQGLDNDYDYAEWYELTKPTEEELAKQREMVFPVQPLLSIVIPAYKTPEKYLRELLDSILSQTYKNWEVCVANGSPKGEGKIVERVMKQYMERDSRFHYKNLGENLGISGNTNAALRMASGDFIVLSDHDDTLPEHALYEVASAVNKHPECDVIYSDEDKLDMDGGALFDPHFKPDFNPDLLTSVNYICHLFVVKRELLDQVGGFRHEFDGAQDYDFIFRCTEAANGIHHIPKVLYHWRCHQDSTASNPESKLYAFEAGAKAIMEHYRRCGIPAEKVEKGADYGIYHTTFQISGNPLVSVVIPNKDHAKDLDLCIRSIIERATYKQLEFVVIENNSTEQETFDYYESIQKEFPQVHVVRWEREFNYSAINNFGAQFAKGEYLLFLNNDTEIIEPRMFEEMLGFCQRKEVGIVGARLLYQDDTIQHAGVVVGFGGIAGHTFIGLHEAENSYFHRAMCAQDYSAVTAACMMTKASVFHEVGGFTEELAVAFNDIDFCMKVRAADYLVVYAPYAALHHYESKSRGLEDTPEKVARFNREVAVFARRWPDILKDGDPYYNPNLTLRKSNFALRDLLKEKIGEPYPLPAKQEENA